LGLGWQVGGTGRNAIGGQSFDVVTPAHRPETVRLANRILLIDEGRLVADGTHERLLDDNTLYRTLLAEMRAKRPAQPRAG